MDISYLPSIFGLCGLVLGFFVGKWRERHRGEGLVTAARVSLEALWTKYAKR